MIILAADPGPSSFGWAVLGWTSTPTVFERARFMAAGQCGSSLEELRALASRAHDRLAIEGHEATIFDGRQAAGQLFATYWAAGRLDAFEHAMWGEQHAPPIVIPASAWRRTFCGSRKPEQDGFRTRDAQIKAIVQQRVDGLPKVFNSHVADALGLALVAALRIQTGQDRRTA